MTVQVLVGVLVVHVRLYVLGPICAWFKHTASH